MSFKDNLCLKIAFFRFHNSGEHEISSRLKSRRISSRLARRDETKI